MEKKKDRKTLLFIVVGVIGLCLITLGITYAYWILTKQQTGENVVNTACLNITFTEENDISLDKAYPMNEDQLASFLSSATPYHFIIHNECNDLASASINLESLAVSGKALEDEYIDAILYEDDYNSNLNTNKKLTGNTPNDENKVISDAKHAYSLYNFTLKANEERDFNLLLYMDPVTPMVDANMNASWKGKITLSTEYQEENTTIRQITRSDTNGMWGYKDKLTKIVIENKKSVKTAEDGGKIYGPYDESADGYGGAQSYVVCDNEEIDCTGYLQGTNGIKANEDSSWLFQGFTNVTKIEGLENLDTSNVINMKYMFCNMTNLQELDLSSFDTSNVTNMSEMFQGCNVTTLDLSMWDTSNVTDIGGIFRAMTELQQLNISNLDLSKTDTFLQLFALNNNLTTINMSNAILPQNSASLLSGLTSLENVILDNIDTSHVNNMVAMFLNCSSLRQLDLSDFDTSNVIAMAGMFNGTTNLQSITFGPKFIHKPEATTNGMFGGCPSQDRPTGDTWNGVSFD